LQQSDDEATEDALGHSYRVYDSNEELLSRVGHPVDSHHCDGNTNLGQCTRCIRT